MKPRHIQPKCFRMIAELILHLGFAWNDFLKELTIFKGSSPCRNKIRDPLRTNLQIGEQLFELKQLFSRWWYIRIGLHAKIFCIKGNHTFICLLMAKMLIFTTWVYKRKSQTAEKGFCTLYYSLSLFSWTLAKLWRTNPLLIFKKNGFVLQILKKNF